MANSHRTRNLTIDILKGILTIGMVWGHMTGGYTGVTNNAAVEALRVVLMMGIFSGFVFSMGYVMQTTYFEQDPPSTRKMLRSSLRSLAGYYFSALAYFLVFKDAFNWQTVKSTLLLQQLGSISEFLLAFALIPLVTMVFAAPLKKYIIPSDRNMFLLIFLLTLTSFLPYDRIHSSYLALFVGSAWGVYYPVAQFYGVFLLGAYFASRRIAVGGAHLVVGGLALVVAVSSSLLGNVFSRFPPSFGWVVCSAALVLLFYKAAEILSGNRFAASILAPFGANSLFVLVVSNIIIFGLSKGMVGKMSTLGATALTGAILAVVFILMTFVRPVKA